MVNGRLLFWFCCLTTNLFSGIEDFFKRVSDTGGSHTMRNIDYIYMINLDERPEKFKNCLDQLSSAGINPHRFSAVNGWKLSIEDINSLGVSYQKWMRQNFRATTYLPENGGEPSYEVMDCPKRVYFCYGMTLGAIGIVLSHLSILQDAYDKGYETIWLMEDDIQIHRDPREIPDLIDRLDAVVGKGNWDIFFTDPDTKNQKGEYVSCTTYAESPDFNPVNPDRFARKERISEDFTRVGARYGAYSMIFRRSGMKKVLDFYKEHQIFLPYDMGYTLPNGIALYSLNYDVISTEPCALSDNRRPTYLKNGAK